MSNPDGRVHGVRGCEWKCTVGEHISAHLRSFRLTVDDETEVEETSTALDPSAWTIGAQLVHATIGWTDGHLWTKYQLGIGYLGSAVMSDKLEVDINGLVWRVQHKKPTSQPKSRLFTWPDLAVSVDYLVVLVETVGWWSRHENRNCDQRNACSPTFQLYSAVSAPHAWWVLELGLESRLKITSPL